MITPDVVELIETYRFPRMKVLQFAFDPEERNNYLPHSYERNSVVYTGTHDNNTSAGWLANADSRSRRYAIEYLHSDGSEPWWDFIRGALASPSQYAIMPIQDILGLGSESRMNTPGTVSGNWSWRLTEVQFSKKTATRLAQQTELYER